VKSANAPVLTAAETAAITRLRTALVRNYGLVRLSLIGSKARGDSSAGSDIDLVVVLKDADWQTERAVYELCSDIGLEFDVLLSPIIFTEQEYNDKLTRTTPFYRLAVAKGIPL